MKILKQLIFIGFILAMIGLNGCKKEDVELEDPLKYKRIASIPAPMYEIYFLPIDIFGELNLPAGITVESDSSVHFLTAVPFTFPWEFDIDLDFKNLVGNEDRKELLENIFIYADFKNGLPFSLNNQIYAMNDAGEIIDSLVAPENVIWKVPEISSDGVVGDAVDNINTIELSYERIDKLYDSEVKKFHIVSEISSEDIYNQPTIPSEIILQNQTMLSFKFSVELNKKTSSK